MCVARARAWRVCCARARVCLIASARVPKRVRACVEPAAGARTGNAGQRVPKRIPRTCAHAVLCCPWARAAPEQHSCIGCARRIRMPQVELLFKAADLDHSGTLNYEARPPRVVPSHAVGCVLRGVEPWEGLGGRSLVAWVVCMYLSVAPHYDCAP